MGRGLPAAPPPMGAPMAGLSGPVRGVGGPAPGVSIFHERETVAFNTN